LSTEIIRVRPSPALGILFLVLAGIDAAMYVSAGCSCSRCCS
jgi:hypothetical protein